MEVDTQQNVLQDTSKDQEQVEERLQTIPELEDPMSLRRRGQNVGTMFKKPLCSFFSRQALRISRLGHIDSSMVPLRHLQVGHEMFIDIDMLLFLILFLLAASFLLCGDHGRDRNIGLSPASLGNRAYGLRTTGWRDE